MSPAPDTSPRLLVTLIGNIHTEPFARVKYGYLIQALEKKYSLTVHDATLRGLPRLWNALQTFHPNIHLWKSRFYQNVAAFHSRTESIQQGLKSMEKDIDLIFQVGVLYDSTIIIPEVPTVIYTDYTSKLARNKPGMGRMPMNDQEYKEWFVLERAVFFQAAHIFTRGSIVRQSVIDDYGVLPTKVTAVGGGVNLDVLPSQHQPANDHPPVVLFIGKEYSRKGGDLVLDAFQEARKTISDARLVMMTDYPMSSSTIPEGVTIVSPTWDRKVISDLFSQADCFVLASRLETWGDVLLEAMAYHIPCIGVSGESMEDIIEDQKTGYIVPTGDVHTLAQTVTELLQNPEKRTSMGEAGYQKVVEYFTWDHVIRRMSPYIDSIIKQHTIEQKSDGRSI